MFSAETYVQMGEDVVLLDELGKFQGLSDVAQSVPKKSQKFRKILRQLPSQIIVGVAVIASKFKNLFSVSI